MFEELRLPWEMLKYEAMNLYFTFPDGGLKSDYT